MELTVFGIVNAHSSACSAPYDSNGALPFTSSGTNIAASITTSNPNDFLMAAFRGGGNNCATSGLTTVVTGASTYTEYKIVSSTQSSLSVTAGAIP
jgi:hypothetical protein